MIGKAAAKAMAVGRFASAVFGLALVLGLMFGVATMALGANGANFILGQGNAATALTRLAGNVQGAAFQVQNTNPGADDTALNLTVQPGEAPMRVTSDTRVTNLNTDKLDGRDASGLTRVASFNGSSQLPRGQNGTVAETQITAPAAGFLVITASSDVFNSSASEPLVACVLVVDDAGGISGTQRNVDLNGAQNVNERAVCSTNVVVPVSAGQHKVELEAGAVDDPNTGFGSTALSAIYVPFGATGSPPPSP